jgi:hypothetical protein
MTQTALQYSLSPDFQRRALPCDVAFFRLHIGVIYLPLHGFGASPACIRHVVCAAWRQTFLFN